MNNEKISKYDLLKLFAKYMKKDIKINKNKDYSSDKSLICTRKDFKYRVKPYDIMIEELSEYIGRNYEDYSNK